MNENKPSAKASIEYLATVLGVTTFLAPEGGFPASEAYIEDQDEVVAHELPQDIAYEGEISSPLAFVANAETLDGIGRDLYERMVKAMKQDSSQVLLLPLGLGQGPHAVEMLKAHPRKAVVAYGLEAAERLAVDEKWLLARWTELDSDIPVIATHSLPDINARPELKKIVWQHLQMAMQRLT